MAATTLTAAPGASLAAAVQIVSSLTGASVAVTFDGDYLVPSLTAADGAKFEGVACLTYVCSLGSGGGDLYPSDAAAKATADAYLDVVSALDTAARAWIPPFSNAADDAARAAAQVAIRESLAKLEAGLASAAFLGGTGVGVADLAGAAALAPLFRGVMGPDVRAAYPKAEAWLAAVLAACADAKTVLGDGALAAADGWAKPAAVEGKKKGKKGKGGGEKSQGDTPKAADAPAADKGPLDPEKEAKKAAKLAAKEAKKQKALEKAKKAAEQAAKAAGNADKKAAAKAEKEAKAKAEAEEVAKIVAAAKATPMGEKKDTAAAMCKGYVPAAVEAAWYEWWEARGFFKPDMESDADPFVIVIPPPNVTGALHIGHALTNAIEDTVVRWHRMKGRNALWVPGTDHAGIATQTVVEKKIAREEGKTRHDIGRDAFLDRVHTWVDEYGGRICDQLRRIGSSVDWDRKAFTMDAQLSKAVNEAFVLMHEKGLIYRDNRLVNWCCRLKTAVSDIEVDYVDVAGRQLMSVPGYDKPVEFGVLTSFAYPLEDGSGEVVVATTRVETMLGDTAVAVHPDDPRYAAMRGKNVVHPVNGRKIPIICDAELVDMSFGTGAVKITPAHDPNDFATGKRHGLEQVNVFDDDGNINANGGVFEGQPRFQARVTVVEFLEQKGLYRGKTDNPMRLGLCSRSKDVIEPCLKPQWWVDCKEMAANACAAVNDGRLEIIPSEFNATWFRWLENIRDWCISRQLWWGHRIPAYYITVEGETGHSAGGPSEQADRWVVGRTKEEAEKLAQERFAGKTITLSQDEDVLDTWFSSGLFPFSTLGWPDKTPDLEKFYPNSLLETGHDILFFWVARMVMMGMTLMGEVPFKQVYLHSMVRDAHGRKMSKSLGNVIDPIHVIEGISLPELHATLEGGNLDEKERKKAAAGQTADFPEGIEECGTDALRFTLVSYTSQARDVNLDINRVVANRHWCNKLWNAIKFAMMNLPEGFAPAAELKPEGLSFPCRWLLSRLSATSAAVNQAMTDYDFSAATQGLYAFWKYDLCDYFIELMKPVMQGADEAAKEGVRQVLWASLDSGLRLLHPFMPFVTEELWQRLPRRADQTQPSIMISPYPEAVEAWADAAAESDMEYVRKLVTLTNGLRMQYGLVSKDKPEVYLQVSDPGRAASLAATTSEIATMTTSGSVAVLEAGAAPPAACGVVVVDDVTTIHMLLKGILDPTKEIAKLEKKVGATQNAVATLEKKRGMPTYAEKTPQKIKDDDAAKAAKLADELASLDAAIQSMKDLALAS